MLEKPQEKKDKKTSPVFIIGVVLSALMLCLIFIQMRKNPLIISHVKEQGVTYVRAIFTDYYRAEYCDESYLEIVIPREIKGKPVKVITTSAFSGCTSIKKITLSNSIETIEANAFHDCSSLSTITIPASVKKINGELANLVYTDKLSYDEPIVIYYQGTKTEFQHIRGSGLPTRNVPYLKYESLRYTVLVYCKNYMVPK